METSIKIENGMESATNTNPQETSTTEAKNRDEGEGGGGSTVSCTTLVAVKESLGKVGETGSKKQKKSEARERCGGE